MRPLLRVNEIKMMEIFNRIPFFLVLTPYERKQLVRKDVIFFAAEAGEHIIEEGADDRHFFILLSGSASVYKGCDKSKVLGRIKPGDFVGEVAFITNQQRSANVFTNETCILLRIDQTTMTKLPPPIRDKIKDKIITGLVSRIEIMNSDSVALQTELNASQNQVKKYKNNLDRIQTEYPHLKNRIDSGKLVLE